MVELRLRSPREIKLSQQELAMCSLENTEAEKAALKAAVNLQIDQAIEAAKLCIRAPKAVLITSTSMYPIVKHS